MKNLKKNQMGIKLIPTFLFIITGMSNSYALVDYSETVQDTSKQSSRPASATSEKRVSAPRASGGGSNSFSSEILTNFESQDITASNAKMNKLNFNAHIETPFNIFLDASYWQGSGSGFSNPEYNKSQSGNPEVKLGFNFFKFGSNQDLATFDIYAGAMLKSSSKLAASRNDQILGVELSKRFYEFGLGLGYELRNTGKVTNPDDYDIGNIQTFKASVGWMATNDIKFQTDFASTSVAKGEGVNGLSKSMTYATLTPKLVLELASVVNLQMGASFLVSKPKDNVATFPLKINGASPNGTMLFAGLGLVF